MSTHQQQPGVQSVAPNHQPEPSPKAQLEYREKKEKAPDAPMVEQVDGIFRLGLPPEGPGRAAMQLNNLTGVTNLFGANYLMHQILGVAPDGNKNPSLALVTELQPQDAVEGMLAAQMVASHNLAMQKAQAAINGKDLSLKQAEYANKTAMNAMRLFTAQVEALARWRNRGKQKITVEYLDNRGGQAVIGDVGQQGRG